MYREREREIHIYIYIYTHVLVLLSPEAWVRAPPAPPLRPSSYSMIDKSNHILQYMYTILCHNTE